MTAGTSGTSGCVGRKPPSLPQLLPGPNKCFFRQSFYLRFVHLSDLLLEGHTFAPEDLISERLFGTDEVLSRKAIIGRTFGFDSRQM